MPAKQSIHGQWSSRWAFVLAATGSAVGLGNIWKFPYMAGESGGGAFVLVYLGCIAVIGIPIMMSEIMLGRRGRQSPINTMYTLAIESGHSPQWKWLGVMGVVAGFIILSYYSVIAGWAIAYVPRAATGTFTGLTVDGVTNIFGSFTTDWERMMGWHTLFMAITIFVVARGVQSGLEQAVKYLMPALFILLIVLLGYAMNTDTFAKGVEFMFRLDFHKLTWGIILSAMGQAFFTLSLGMGAIMVYGSYLPRDASIAGTTVTIAAADTLVAILAGMAIFPIVFANGLEPDSGPSLIFITLPMAFGHMPGGALFGTLFFLLLTFAALTSSISLMEPAVTWLVENVGMKRMTATLLVGLLIWMLGIATVFSFIPDSPLKFSFELAGTQYDSGVFNILDIATANFMLPLGGFFIAVFAAWFMSRDASRDELNLGEAWAYQTWRFLVRYVAPILVFLVFLNVSGIFKV
jgi:NSS family neurotransmitter:Na+ symporter